MKVQETGTEKVKPYEHNPRNNDDAVEYVANSIKEFGFQQPIVVDKNMVVIVGHTRLKAAKRLGLKKVPIVVADNLTPEQVKAYRLADNKTNELADWNDEELITEIEGINDLDMVDFGFDIDFSDLDTSDEFEEDISEDNFEVPDEQEIKTQIKKGDIFRLGNHILMCGDSTSNEDVRKLMNGEKASLVFTDPPYGMRKEKDGVANDNLNYNLLLEFNKKWIPLTFEALRDNGSWYCWGIDEPLMDIYSEILKPMIKERKLTFRNLITWDKKHAQSQHDSIGRRYATADEKCLFVVKGIDETIRNASEFYPGYKNVEEYLESEAKAAGITSKVFNEMTGTQMFSHYFTKSQWALLPEELYNELHQKFPNNFKKKYKELRNEFVEEQEKLKASRAYFDNTFDNFNNVWHFDRTSKEERELTGGHATPKPIALCSRAIKASSRPDDVVLDVFGGSGSTLIACEKLNRCARLMELEPKWCQTIINRWEALTGEQAKKIN